MSERGTNSSTGHSGHGHSLNLSRVAPRTSLVHPPDLKHSSSYSLSIPLISNIVVCPPFRLSVLSRIRSLSQKASRNDESENTATNEILENQSSDTWHTFLRILIAALGVAAILTVISAGLGPPSAGLFSGVQCLDEISLAAVLVGYNFKAFGYRIILPEYAPGWLYFWLLMAAGCGLFINEEALNIWLGISWSRMLSFDGMWQSFATSFSMNCNISILGKKLIM
ncbi:hypothetical protein LINGRAHAP2_LOCUS29126 [Linum grandiflorum]